MQRRMLLGLPASVDDVAEAARTSLRLDGDPDALRGSLPVQIVGDTTLSANVADSPEGGSRVTLRVDTPMPVAYFRWLFGPLTRILIGRALRHAGECLKAELAGDPAPPPPRRSPITPPVVFSREQAVLLSAVAFAALLASFGGGLFGQNAAFIQDAFDVSDSALTVSLAVTRVGVFVAIVAAAIADRRGRRRILLWSLAGIGVANAIGAASPNLEIFTASQVVARGLVNAALAVAVIAVVEEAPEGARAFSVAMLSLAGGAGFAVAVLLLPLGDLGPEAWRVAFALSALTLLFIPGLSRVITETRRYRNLDLPRSERGQASEVTSGRFGRRIVILAAFTFLTSILAAPSSQLMNVYLEDDRGFSGSAITVFRAITQGLPALVGVLIGARLAETRGRKPLLSVGLAAATLLTIAFYLSDGAALWVTSAVGIVIVGTYGPAQGAFSTELFPTEVRGTSSAMLLVCGVSGSIVGLVAAGLLSDPLGGIGRAVAVLGVAPLVAAIVLVPFLPEAAHRGLDDLSPSRHPGNPPGNPPTS
ncbi:MAG: MFS transporter [Acidimicrobiia bacterium]|nr:MFS transporter [Acidimicrobiia bacterium]